MKFIAVFLILLTCLVAYWFFKPRSKLVAVSNFEGKITPWGSSEAKKTKQIEEAYQLTKELVPQTLEIRMKARDSKFAQDLPVTIYFVEEKEWLYIFADNYPFKAPGMELIGSRSFKNSIHFHIPTKKFELKIN